MDDEERARGFVRVAHRAGLSLCTASQPQRVKHLVWRLPVHVLLVHVMYHHYSLAADQQR